MGVGYRPGRVGRPVGGGHPEEPEAASGLEAIAQYGVGERDPFTGSYEAYDFPEGHPATQTAEEGRRVTRDELLAAPWDLIGADFASEYAIRLVGSDIRWPEFRLLLTGLLSADTRIARYFAPARKDEGSRPG